ncbi:MAG: DUF4097 domain-containing protein [Clostridia bacterium]|nr:DUF4097 domain-containing protein [Clostridia bacterium]
MTNSFALARIIIWSVVALVLIAVLVLGIIFGSRGLFGRDNWGRNFSLWDGWANESSYKTAEGRITVPGKDIKNLDVRWVSGSLVILQHEDKNIAFEETGTSDGEPRLRYYQDGDRLYLRTDNPRRMFGFSLRNRSTKLTVWVPSDLSLNLLDVHTVSAPADLEIPQADRLNAESVSGSVTLRGGKFDNLGVETVSGRIEANGLTAKNCTFNTVSGSIEATGLMGSVRSETVSGSQRLAPGKDVKTITMDTVSGRLTAELPGGIKGFYATYSTVSGGFSCDFAVETRNKTVTFGDGGTDMRFNSVSGSIKIAKVE